MPRARTAPEGPAFGGCWLQGAGNRGNLFEQEGETLPLMNLPQARRAARLALLALAFVLGTMPAKAQQISLDQGSTTLSGKAETHAGDTLVFYAQGTFEPRGRQVLGRAVVGADGGFALTCELRQTTVAYLDLGPFLGRVVLEPGQSYRLSLPQKQELTEADRFNPYFVPMPFAIAVSNGQQDELNYLLRLFDQNLDNFLVDNFYQVTLQPEAQRIERNIDSLAQPFEGVQNPFFWQYAQYRFAYLRYLSYQRNRDLIIREYFQGKPFQPNNPAYMETLDRIFDQHLIYLHVNGKAEGIGRAIVQRQSYTQLDRILAQQPALDNDSLREYVLLRSLLQGYHSGDFPRPAALALLDSATTRMSVPPLREAANRAFREVAGLSLGAFAPAFALPDLNGKMLENKDFQGKFVYLNFVHSQSFTSQEEMALLGEIRRRHGAILEVVTISLDEDFEQMRAFARARGYGWPILDASARPDIARAYQVKAYPTYYLLDPSGRLAMSPAASPSQDFLERMTLVYDGWRQRQMQQQRQGGASGVGGQAPGGGLFGN